MRCIYAPRNILNNGEKKFEILWKLISNFSFFCFHLEFKLSYLTFAQKRGIYFYLCIYNILIRFDVVEGVWWLRQNNNSMLEWSRAGDVRLDWHHLCWYMKIITKLQSYKGWFGFFGVGLAAWYMFSTWGDRCNVVCFNNIEGG